MKEPRDLFMHGLGEALYVERKVLTMLKDAAENAQDAELKEQFRHHHAETEGQIANLEQAFSILGEEVKGSKCPAIDGIREEQKEMLSEAEDSMIDLALLDGAAKTEHYELAIYSGLVTFAEQMGQEDLVALFQENLEQEQATSKKVESAVLRLAQQHVQSTA